MKNDKILLSLKSFKKSYYEKDYKNVSLFKIITSLINLVVERRTFDPVTGVRFPHGVNSFYYFFVKYKININFNILDNLIICL